MCLVFGKVPLVDVSGLKKLPWWAAERLPYEIGGERQQKKTTRLSWQAILQALTLLADARST